MHSEAELSVFVLAQADVVEFVPVAGVDDDDAVKAFAESFASFGVVGRRKTFVAEELGAGVDRGDVLVELGEHAQNLRHARQCGGVDRVFSKITIIWTGDYTHSLYQIADHRTVRRDLCDLPTRRRA